MEKRHKIYLRLNLMSLFFIVASFISATLAWFAYSGLSTVSTEVGVKAWYIELEKNGEEVSNDIVISLPQIYPGMDTVNEKVNIKNLGDADAQVKYSIVSARILGDASDNYIVDSEENISEKIEDILSHDYPFHVNINLSKQYVLSKGEESSFEVSVSWPLDSDTNALDSLWGTKAYQFQTGEETSKAQNENYQIRPPIQIVISLTAEQYLENDDTSDIRFNLGDIVLFDVANSRRCSELSSTCITTYIIDTNNKIGDETVTLLPDPKNDYASGIYSDYSTELSNLTATWTATTRSLQASDIMKIISTDVMQSLLIRENISDTIMGDLKYGNRITTEITKAVNYNGYYKFMNDKFSYLPSVNCYWTNSEYNIDNGFAVKKIDENNSKLYGESKSSSCKVVPVIIASKSSL